MTESGGGGGNTVEAVDSGFDIEGPNAFHVVRHHGGKLAEQLLDLGQVPLMGGEPVDDRMHWQRPAVPFGLVAAEGDPHRVVRRGTCDDGPGQQLGVAECVGDSVGGQRILPRPGVPDQCPARSRGASQSGWQAAEESDLAQRRAWVRSVSRQSSRARRSRAASSGRVWRSRAASTAAGPAANTQARPSLVGMTPAESPSP